MKNTIKLMLAVLLGLLMAFMPALAEAADGTAAEVVEEAVEETAEATEETAEEAEEEETPKSWFQTAFGEFSEASPVTLVMIAVLLVLGVLLIATGKANWTSGRLVLAITCFGGATVLALVSLFRSLGSEGGTGPYIVTIVVLLAVMALVICIQRREKWTSRRVAYAAMCIAMAFILSMIKLFRMPQGGTVTPASLLPLILFSMAFGPVQGIVVGIAYGLLQLIEDPYVIHPIQLLVDYPMAFGAIALSSLAMLLPTKDLRVKLPVGVLLGYLGRYFMAVLSGVVFFSEYAGEQNALVYSLVYNISYLGIEAVITCAISCIPGFARILESMRKK